MNCDLDDESQWHLAFPGYNSRKILPVSAEFLVTLFEPY